MFTRFNFGLVLLLFGASTAQSPPKGVSVGIGVVPESERMAIYTPDPPYTEEARKAQVKGSVHLWIMIGEDGCARDIKVARSLGYGLDESAVAALKIWRFRKLERPARVMVEVNFYDYQTPSKLLNEPTCIEFMNSQKLAPKTSGARKIDRTLFLQCDETKPPANVKARSPILVSADGQHRAYVEVESAMSAIRGACMNRTKLWVAETEGGQFKLFYMQPPGAIQSFGNGMRLVDWSPNGHWLLAELWQWNTMPNDADFDKDLVLVDGRTGEVLTVLEDELKSLWNDQKDKRCRLNYEVLGFTPEGQIALKTYVTTHIEIGEELSDIPVKEHCMEKREVWAFGPFPKDGHLLSNDFQAAHYGTVAAK